MIIGVLFFLSIALSAFTAIKLREGQDIVESSAVGIATYFCVHAIVSFFEFVLDVYSPFLTVLVSFIIVFILLVVLLTKKIVTLKGAVNIKLKESLIPLVIVLLMIPFVSVKNEYFGLGQDQGGYQTQAMGFVNGDTKAIKDYSEYYSLPEYYKDAYLQQYRELPGWDVSRTGYFDANYSKDNSPLASYVHGIPVFSALMATWASVFGVSNMQGIQTVFYALLLLLVYYSVINLTNKKYIACLSSIIVGFSPVIIWVGKSAFTEMFMTVLLACFLYFVTADKKLYRYSIIPVFAYACYHVSFFTIAPVFIGVYGVIYYLEHKKEYAVLLYSVPLIQLVGFWGMVKIQPVYTLNNYRELFRYIPLDYQVTVVPWVVLVLCALYMIGIIVFILLVNKYSNKLDGLSSLSGNKWFLWFVRLLIIVPFFRVARSLFKLSYESKIDLVFFKWVLKFLRTRTIYHFAINSTFIIFSIVFILIIIHPEKMFRTVRSAIISVMFFYCVIIYSTLLMSGTFRFYYGLRYMTPFIAVSVVFVMYFASSFKKIIVIPSVVIGLCLFVSCNYNLLKNVDDTIIDWNTLTDITELVGPDDTVIIQKDAQNLMWISMENLTDSNIYPQIDDYFVQADELSAVNSGDTYIITFMPFESDDSRVELSYSNEITGVHASYYHRSEITLYPNDFAPFDRTIYVYRIVE